MSWIAEYDTQGREFPTCVHVTKTTGNMTHGATYVPIEDGKAVRDENAKLVVKLNAEHIARQNVEIENAKLREQLEYDRQTSRSRLERIDQLAAENRKLRELLDYMTPIALYAASEQERDRMRELGIEGK